MKTATTTAAPQMVVQYPTLVKRVQSMFVDGIFILLLMFGISAIIDKAGDAPDWLRAVLFIGLWFVYEPVCIAFGCTLGQYLMGLRVREAANEKKRINIVLSFVRFALKLVLGWLSFLTIHTNSQRRAIHDLAGQSVMLEIKKPDPDDE
jgi:uncharacterized RDD family membrane protein YckC